MIQFAFVQSACLTCRSGSINDREQRAKHLRCVKRAMLYGNTVKAVFPFRRSRCLIFIPKLTSLKMNP